MSDYDINEKYNALLAEQRAKADADFEQAKAQYRRIMGLTEEQYDARMHEAATQQAMLARSIRDGMEGMGVDAEAAPRTISQRDASGLARRRSRLLRQQDSFEGDAALAMANLDSQHAADSQNLTASSNVTRNGALLSQAEFDAQLDQNEKQLEQARQQSAFTQAYELYQKRLISKKKFKEMTGITLK